MKTVQQWLCSVDEEAFAGIYFTCNPVDYSMLPNSDLSLTDVRKRIKDKFLDFVHQLKDIAICQPKEEPRYVFFAHKTYKQGHPSPTVAMVSLSELIAENQPECYSWVMMSQAECMGVFLAETEYTVRYIMETLAEILYELSFFGYSQTQQDVERKKFKKSIQEADEGKTYSLEEVRTKLGIMREPKDDNEAVLEQNILKAELSYHRYSYEKELENTRQTIIHRI